MLHLNSRGLRKLAINFMKKIKCFKRSKISQNSKISCPEIEDSGRSDKPNSFTLNFNDLHEIRLKNPNRLIFTYININSLRNKFEMLQEVIGNNVDVLLISETKLDPSFPSGQLNSRWIHSTYMVTR